MSLYFEERMNEQKEDDPENGKIVFSHPWILEFPRPPNPHGENEMLMGKRFATVYGNENATWYMYFSKNDIKLRNYNNHPDQTRVWNGTCFISYNLFYDVDMRYLFHSSPRIKMTESPNVDCFKTPEGYMTKIMDAINKRIIRKMVIFIELHLPTKYFYRPFEKPTSYLLGSFCDEYPEDMTKDCRFGFLNKSDYSIKCPDGSIPCRRIVINLTSKLMRRHFAETKDIEMVVEHSIDVVKLVVTFLHSLCFKMPKFYDLDFAKRLLKAVDYFEPEQITNITSSIHQSLCKKFVSEIHDFDSILVWTSIASQNSLPELQDMVSSLIVNKYYFKWQQQFPENARNVENAMFRPIFGSEDRPNHFCEMIESLFSDSFCTNVILQ